jgi:hypothetical protein
MSSGAPDDETCSARSRPPVLAVIGNGVHDRTVELDLERLRYVDRDVGDKIRIAEDGRVVAIRTGTRLKVVGPLGDWEVVDLRPAGVAQRDGFLRFVPSENDKFDHDPAVVAPPGPTIEVPRKRSRWGGGGVGAITAMRALSPAGVTPLRYVDIGRPITESTRFSENLARVFELVLTSQPLLARSADLLHPLAAASGAGPSHLEALSAQLRAVGGKVLATINASGLREEFYQRTAKLFRTYSEGTHLEMYLDELAIEFSFFRHPDWKAISNLVISKVRDGSFEVNNKILIRGERAALPPDVGAAVRSDVSAAVRDASVLMINTIYDQTFFDAAIDVAIRRQGEGTRIIWAMTEKTAAKIKELQLKNQLPPSFFTNSVFIFNAPEFAAFLGDGEFAGAERRLPRVSLIRSLVKRFTNAIHAPFSCRLYVTLGARGSLGVTQHGEIIYTGTYGHIGREIHDTTGAGDAYAGALALMEYHGAALGLRRNERQFVMQAMAIASAAAYSKATNPLGTVVAEDVARLVSRAYVPAETVAWVGDDGRDGARVEAPETARRYPYADELAKVIRW